MPEKHREPTTISLSSSTHDLTGLEKSDAGATVYHVHAEPENRSERITDASNLNTVYHLQANSTLIPPSSTSQPWDFTLYSKASPSKGGLPVFRVSKQVATDSIITFKSLTSSNRDDQWKRYLRSNGSSKERFEFVGAHQTIYLWRRNGQGDYVCVEKANERKVASMTRVGNIKGTEGDSLIATITIEDGNVPDNDILMASALSIEALSRSAKMCIIS